jgi:hypothetical protein
MSKGSIIVAEKEFLRLVHLRFRSVDKRLNIARFGFQVEGGTGRRANLTVEQVSNMIELKFTMETPIGLLERAVGTPPCLSSRGHGELLGGEA